MKTFDNSELERYKKEAKKKWGGTEAYKEYEEKSKEYTKGDFDTLGEDMDNIMDEFARCMREDFYPEGEEAQALVKKLQEYITGNFYTCTKEILHGIGQMYAFDESFKNSIDRHGDGTAQFISMAISIYCR